MTDARTAHTQHPTPSSSSDKEKTMRFVKPAHLLILFVMAAAMFLMPANVSVSQASSQPPKLYLRHYNELGSWDGFHRIDEELDWYLTKVILENGGLPTDENKDRLLHGR